MKKTSFNPAFFKSGPDMVVLKTLPSGIKSLTYAPYKAVGSGNRQFHFCKNCGGWIEGSPLVQTEDDLPEFAEGRRGTVVRCRRMGHEIGFTGVYNKLAERIEKINKIPEPKAEIRVQRGTGGIGG